MKATHTSEKTSTAPPLPYTHSFDDKSIKTKPMKRIDSPCTERAALKINVQSLKAQNTAGGREKAVGGVGKKGGNSHWSATGERDSTGCMLLLCSRGGARDGDKAKHQGRPQRLRFTSPAGRNGQENVNLGPWMGEDVKQEEHPLLQATRALLKAEVLS